MEQINFASLKRKRDLHIIFTYILSFNHRLYRSCKYSLCSFDYD